MSKIDDSGPAFPTEPNKQPGFYLHHGTSLRDWFAGQALSGMMGDNYWEGRPPTEIARWAYDFADGMIKVRKEKP
jgi:hypothetical protein